MKPTLDYNEVPWKDIVEYDPSAPTFLIWRISRSDNRGGNKNVKQGAVAGCYRKSYYSTITYGGVGYRVHRVVWILHYGALTNDEFIDHIDGNKANNSIDNLRVVTVQINGQNMKKMSSNTSGVVGVTFQVNKCNNEYWVAQWRCFKTGKPMAKTFSLLKYGEEAFQMACDYRLEMIDQQNVAGAYYTDRHIAGI